MDKQTCFVVMGFGKKVDFETGKTFDLDMTYKNLIKPAVEAAGVECVRADEVIHAGVIDVPMYQRLLEADLVVADISTGNRNAIYELGVRHALRPHTTIIIGEDSNAKIPFDLNHIVIRKYRHLGEDIGASEARRVSTELTSAIKELLASERPSADSPVYTFLPRLRRPVLDEVVAAGQSAGASSQPAVTMRSTATMRSAVAPQPDQTLGAMLALAREAQAKEDFAKAKSLLESIVALMKAQSPDRPIDPTILQQLALVTYKSKLPSAIEALRAARTILVELEPATTNDTETLGLWGAIHKRVWQLTKDRTSLDEAVRALERGFYIRNDYYNGINLAYMLNERALEQSDPAEATADFILARRVRREVREIAKRWLTEATAPASEHSPDSIYWALATLAEAAAGLGDEADARHWLNQAAAMTPAPAAWMVESSQTQLANLRSLLDAGGTRVAAQVPQPGEERS